MVLIKSLNLGRERLTVNLGAEELFRPSDQDCPDRTPAVSEKCKPDSPEYSPEECPPLGTPSDNTTETGSTGWYSEDCDDCCHPLSDKVIDYMELVVVTFTSPGYTEDISCPDVNIDDLVAKAVIDGVAKVTTLDPKSHTAKTLSNTLVRTKPDGTQIYDLDYVTDIPIEEETEHLEVVSYMKVDFERMKQDKDIDVPASLQNSTSKLMGKQVSHETIKTSGKTVENSFVYTEPDTGKVWEGPVHRHPTKGIMKGARHTNLPHSTLVTKRVPNLKLQDDTVKDDILNLDIGAEISKDPILDIDQAYNSTNKDKIVKAYISEPISSRSRDGKTRFLFSIDNTSLVRMMSRYPGLRDSSIYQKAPIEGLEVYRLASTDKYDLTELGTAKVSDASKDLPDVTKSLIVSTVDNKSYNETPSMYSSRVLDAQAAGTKKASRYTDKNFDGVGETKVGSIEEIYIKGMTDNCLRVFSVEDSEISSFTSGKWGYTVSLTFKDPSVSYLNRKLSELCAAKDSLVDLSSTIISLRAYDSTNKRFKDKYKSKHGTKHNKTVKDAAFQVIDISSVTTGLIDKRKINYLSSLSSLRAGTPSGIETLIEIMNAYEEKLYTLLEGSLDIDNSANANIEKNVGITNSSKSDLQLITIEKSFDYLVDRSIPDDYGIDYFNAKIRSFPQLTTKEYEQRANQSDQSNNDTQGFDPNATQESDNGYGFLIPETVTAGGVVVEITEETSEQEYEETNILSAGTFTNGTHGTFNGVDVVDLAEDILNDLGVTINTPEDNNDQDKNIDQKDRDEVINDPKKIFGDKSFNNDSVDKDQKTKPRTRRGFGRRVIIRCGNEIIEAAKNKGDLDPNSPKNNDQEVKDSKDIQQTKNEKEGKSIKNQGKPGRRWRRRRQIRINKGYNKPTPLQPKKENQPRPPIPIPGPTPTPIPTPGPTPKPKPKPKPLNPKGNQSSDPRPANPPGILCGGVLPKDKKLDKSDITNMKPGESVIFGCGGPEDGPEDPPIYNENIIVTKPGPKPKFNLDCELPYSPVAGTTTGKPRNVKRKEKVTIYVEEVFDPTPTPGPMPTPTSGPTPTPIPTPTPGPTPATTTNPIKECR